MKIYIVDAFTNEAFKGNPAGVCFLEHEVHETTMLKIAQELNLSETAFVQKTDSADCYTIRYFSPKKEIPLCGHATMGSAKIIFQNTTGNEIHFITSEKLGLRVRREGHAIAMEFPVYDTVAATVPQSLVDALGLVAITKTTFSPKNRIIILEIEDANLLASLNPNYEALIRSYDGINGVLVTAPSNDKDYDFHYRYFWPWAGTNEDPVTGGVQTFLAKYWGEKLNKKRMKAFQSSKRTGSMTVELKENKVFIYGEAVVILEGNLVSVK